jgi:hypothetical protein
MPYLNRDGVNIYYQERGKGPAVLLSHGLQRERTDVVRPDGGALRPLSFNCVRHARARPLRFTRQSRTLFA